MFYLKMTSLIAVVLSYVASPHVSSKDLASSSSHTSIGYEKFLRLNKPQNKAKSSDWLQVGQRYSYKENNFTGELEGDARLYLNNTSTSLSLSQAYLKYTSESNSTYSLGRQSLNWHQNETFWQLDHLQGSRGFRLTETKQEGLTGFHYKTHDKFISTEIFFSYFYLPALNPSVKIEDGKVSSNSDWYKRPPLKTIVSGQEVDIFYNLNRPDYKDIIIQKSLGVRGTLNWGEKETKGQLSAFTIYKPERRLRVNAEAYYDPGLDKVVVNANPIVNHHLIFAGELKQRIKKTTTTLGFVTIDPNAKLGADFDSLSISIENNRNLDSSFFKIEPKYNRETYAHYSTVYTDKLFNLSLNYIHYFSKHDKGSDDFYSETIKWKRAFGIASSYQFNDWIGGNISFRYDTIRKDNLLNAQIKITPWRSSIITLGTELIKSPATSSYWSAYRTNDTFYMNASYIF